MNDLHYNKISDAWLYLLGDNFHWGYFQEDHENLQTATDNLTIKMAEMAEVKMAQRILDIGCGTGNVSLFLNKKYHVFVDGFSNSSRGIEIATSKIRDNKTAEVSFFVRDALNNGFKSDFYDVGWCLEMSHLLEDKHQLLKESLRCVKKGGKLVLCDLMFKRTLTAREIVHQARELRVMENAFGKARMETYDFYKTLFASLGLTDISFLDIADNVIPTLGFWKKNALEYKDELLKSISETDYNDFLESCDILKEMYDRKIWGYGIIIGTK